VKFRRYSIKSRESKRLLFDISKRFAFDLQSFFTKKSKIEFIEIDNGNLILIEGKPLFFKTSNLLIPTLLFTEFHSCLPRITVDMGAIPFVCKGANVMIPGIVGVDGDFKEGDLLLVVDEKHSKAIAIAESLLFSDELCKIKKGVAAKNLHFVGDKIWNFATKLIEK